MDNLFVNKKVWEAFDEKQLDAYIEQVFAYFRSTGFPIYPDTKKYKDKEFYKLSKYDTSDIIKDSVIHQTMHGLSLAWSYFPHSWEVICNDSKTPLDTFNDDTLFKEVIKKRLKYGDNMSEAMIRKVLKVYCGAQTVSNFRPTAAAAIYDYFKAKTVWDMCGGWGGRLLGAIVSKSVTKYIATEPSTKTYDGLLKLNKDYGYADFEIYNMCAEDFVPAKESLDLCFTSPPYFDREKYSNETSQSYIKFPTRKRWIAGFLDKMLANCAHGTKLGGHVVINIANVSGHEWLEEATKDCAANQGLLFQDILKLKLSGGFGVNVGNFKYEKVFVFKKVQ